MTSEFGWVLIRQDEGGSRYRVGRYATRAEAERVAAHLAASVASAASASVASAASAPAGGAYLIEQVVPRAAQA